MFDMSWGELLVIGCVALVVIGPKDLPKVLRAVGNAVGKMRRMAGEFQSQFNEAMREADLEELRKTASDVSDAVAPFKSQFDPFKDAGTQLQKAIESPAVPEQPVIGEETVAAAKAGPKKRTSASSASKKSQPVAKSGKAASSGNKPSAGEKKPVKAKATDKASPAKAVTESKKTAAPAAVKRQKAKTTAGQPDGTKS